MIVDEAAGIIDGMPVPAAGILTVDPAHSSIDFHVRHLMIAKVTGRSRPSPARSTSRPIPSSPGPRSASTPPASTPPTRSGTRTCAPQTPSAEQFPTIEFRRGATHPVAVDCEYKGLATDPWGNERLVVTAESEFDRTRWGLNWNQALETGGVLVSAEVQVQAEIQAVRQA